MVRVNSKRGFTIIEVLLAIAVGSMVMTAAAYFLYSVVQLLAVTAEKPQFVEHVNTVESFLSYVFRTSSKPEYSQKQEEKKNKGEENSERNNQTGESEKGDDSTENKSSSQGMASAQGPTIQWSKPEGSLNLDDPMLSCYVAGNIPLFTVEEGPPKILNFFIKFKKGEGLSLLWYPVKQSEDDGDPDIFRTSISPWVQEMHYGYYDAEGDSWEISDRPLEKDDDSTPGDAMGSNPGNKEYKLPDTLILVFKHDGEERTARLYLPKEAKDGLVY